MRPERIPGLPWREVDGRVVVLAPKRGEIHELSPVGSFLWSLSDGEVTVEDMAGRLVERYDVERIDALADADRFFADLEALGLVRLERGTNAGSL